MINAAPVDGCGILAFQQRTILLLTRSGGYECAVRSASVEGGVFPQRLIEDVVLFFFRAHGEECRRDDHCEKYQCEDEIVDHWGSLLWAALAVFE